MLLPSISAFTAGMSLSACTQARTKKLMNPSFTPCFFSNRSLYSARNAITCVMSTSLKVVSVAAVFCASLSRRAQLHGGRGLRDRRGRRDRARDRVQHVALGDAAVLAAARHGRCTDAAFR